jgi:hypothetical protein
VNSRVDDIQARPECHFVNRFEPKAINASEIFTTVDRHSLTFHHIVKRRNYVAKVPNLPEKNGLPIRTLVR